MTIDQREAALERLDQLTIDLTDHAHNRAWSAVQATQAEIDAAERELYALKGE